MAAALRFSMRAMYVLVNKRFMQVEPNDSAPTPVSRSPNISDTTKRVPPLVAGRRNPWLVFVLPFIVYMVVGSIEPGPPTQGEATPAAWIGLRIEYRHYPLVYSVKILLTIAAMIYVAPGYRQIPCRSPLLPLRANVGSQFALAFVVGLLGAIGWVGLAWAQRYVQDQLGWSPGIGERPAFNPLKELTATPALAYAFLGLRFLGLAVIVPVIEECFLRGFVMRFVVAADWWRIPIGTATRAALIVGTVVPVLMHPNEAVAAAVWFSAVTWLAIRTRNLWACILAHAITNLVLGLYVVATNNWWLM